MRQRKVQLEAELARLVNAIAEGQPSHSFMSEIGELEKELQTFTNKLLGPGPGLLLATLDELRTFAVSRLTKIRELISHPETIDLARAVLAEHFGAFTLEPTIQDGEPVYLAHGKVDFFGDDAIGWCRGPESNWLRPPFQGGALPLSYPGTCGVEIVWGAARLCQFA
jgi:hypothetical protein